MYIVDEDLLEVLYKLCSGFCVSSVYERFYKEFQKNIYMKMIVTIIPTNLVTNSLLSLFCPFTGPKNKNQIFSKLVVS